MIVILENMIITGPNASGKTTFLKTTSINIICSQQIGADFFTMGSLHPYTHIHSYLNIPDTSQRDSLFQAESRRCKDILDIVRATVSRMHDTLVSLMSYIRVQIQKRPPNRDLLL